jgi:putative phosphoesterase
MKIGILADTHNELLRTHIAVKQLRDAGAEVLIHCGDLATPDVLEVCAVLPCYFVFGNHDADNVPYLRECAERCGAVCLGWGDVTELAGKRIGVVHGHLRSDLQRVLSAKPQYLLSGHAHFSVDCMEGALRRINPGALHRADEFTVALLDLETEELRFLTVVD